MASPCTLLAILASYRLGPIVGMALGAEALGAEVFEAWVLVAQFMNKSSLDTFTYIWFLGSCGSKRGLGGLGYLRFDLGHELTIMDPVV